MKCIVNLLFVFQFIKFIVCLKQLDIQPYIDKMEAKLENFATPSPEFVDEFLVQLQASCKDNVTMNPGMITDFNSCMDDIFNVTSLVTEFRESIPKGDLDVVFRNLCLKWPTMKNCMKDGMDFLSQCWGDNNSINQLKIGMDAAVRFFCGNENDGAKIACTGISCIIPRIFFAEDGLSCLEDHAEDLSECLTEQMMESQAILSIPNAVCKAANNLYQCITIFKRCPNVTPGNLIHSLVKYIGKEMNCGIFPESSYIYPEPKLIPSSSEVAEEKKMKDSLTGLIFNNLVSGKLKNLLEVYGNSECIRTIIDSTKECSINFSELSHLKKIHNIPWICKRFLEWNTKCMEPHKDQFQNCTTNVYIALSFVNDLCSRDNGTMIREIVDNGEKHCKSKESSFHWFNECVKLHYKGEEPFLSQKSLSIDFCETMSISRHCIMEALAKCKNQKTFHQV